MQHAVWVRILHNDHARGLRPYNPRSSHRRPTGSEMVKMEKKTLVSRLGEFQWKQAQPFFSTRIMYTKIDALILIDFSF